MTPQLVRQLRIVLCANGLAHRMGHDFNLAAGMREELAARGIPLTVLSNVEIEPVLRSELDAVPAFDTTPYHSLTAASRRRQVPACLRSAWRFAVGLRRAGIRSHDLVFVPTARPAEILGLAGWSWTNRQRPGAVVLNLMTDDFCVPMTCTPRRVVQLLYRLGLGLLRLRLGRARLLLTTASESLASSFGTLTGERVAVAPMIKAYPPPWDRTDNSTPTIGFLGTPRRDKGVGLLPRIVETCARSHPAFRIVVQLPEAVRGPAGGWPANVEVLPVGLDRERYFHLLTRLDLVVLPYDRSRFGNMVSGVFAEAVASGAATVVPAGTWMAAMLESGRGAGVVFDDFSVPAIAGAVSRATRKLDLLQSQAAKMRDPWRANQSISAYLEQLFRELDHR